MKMRHETFRRSLWLGAAMSLGLWMALPGSAVEDKIANDQPAAESKADSEAAKKAEQEKQAKEAQARMEEMIRKAEEARKAELERLQNDPTWKPAMEEVGVIKVGDETDRKESSAEFLHNFCLAKDGKVLAAYGGKVQVYGMDPKTGAAEMKEVGADPEIRVFTPEGKRVATWKLEFQPQALCVAKDGSIFVGGDGHIAKLSAKGKLLATNDLPSLQKKEEKPKDDEKADGEKKETKKKGVLSAMYDSVASANEEQTKQAEAMQKMQEEAMARRQRNVTGIAVSDKDLFVVTSMKEGYGSCVWRTDLDFQNPEVVVKNLSGCCGQMDVQSHEGDLWIPENAKHRVSHYDRDGDNAKHFGKFDRKEASGFGGCCEPKNIRFLPDGDILTAESGPPVVVKRFSPTGEFRGVVALPTYKTGCVRVTVEVNQAADRVFLLNPGEETIHVFAPKKAAEGEQK